MPAAMRCDTSAISCTSPIASGVAAPCPAHARAPTRLAANMIETAPSQRWLFGDPRLSANIEAARRAARTERTCQVSPNRVCVNTIQATPWESVAAGARPRILPASKISHAAPETMPTSSPSHTVQASNRRSTRCSSPPAAPRIGSAIRKRKTIAPSSIIIAAKCTARAATNGSIKMLSNPAR